jgi:hypothetical protein
VTAPIFSTISEMMYFLELLVEHMPNNIVLETGWKAPSLLDIDRNLQID